MIATIFFNAVIKGLFTWREGTPANRATRLTELPWAG